ncbi:hypothetical protein ACFPM0_30045 [Pseudonocardia sulfidoxydans]|uniref:hypothetical protein n=1 Tax=Pseudonocardia sulfidoxydans TaxID=54011 RepID=UPI00360D12F9
MRPWLRSAPRVQSIDLVCYVSPCGAFPRFRRAVSAGALPDVLGAAGVSARHAAPPAVL